MSGSQVADHASAGRLDARPPAASLATALLGNGALLVPLDAWGEPLALHWPRPDRALGGAALRFVLPGEESGEGRQACVQRVEDAADVVTTLRPLREHPDGQLRLRQLVHPEDDALIVELALEGPIAADLDVSVEVGGPSAADGVLAVAVDGSAPHVVARGELHSVALTLVDAATVTLVLALGQHEVDARSSAQRLAAAGFTAAHDTRAAHDRRVAATRTATLVDGALERLDAVGGRVLRALRDRRDGAVIAAPECDPQRVRSGGYGFVWVRDLALIAIAAAVAGDGALARDALRWLPRARSADGLFEQRHHTDGRVAPGWGLQLDETGAALHAIAEVARLLDEPALVDELWPTIAAAADALVALLDADTGLPAASMDPWEERLGVHTFTAAATAAGLAAAATLATSRDVAAARRWGAAAERVRAGIDRWLWSEEHGRFLRSRDVARVDAEGTPAPRGYLPAQRRPDAAVVAGRPVHDVASVDAIDATVDASLLGLSYPFGVVAHDDPRMLATIDAVARELTTPCGALLRYPGDTYLGGNPWVLTTLWLGLARRAPGAAVVADGLDVALAAASPALLLPEQVDAVSGRPVWVVPLAWSHAFALLASRPDHRVPPA
jgi:glucoamylase